MLIRLVGLRAAHALLVPVAAYFLVAAPRARRASAQWRRRVGHGDRARWRRLWGAYRHFFCFGQILLDRLVVIRGQGRGFHFEYDGEERLEAVLGQKRGLVVVSAHVGNWEAAAHIFARHRVPVNIVAYEGERPRIRQMLEQTMAGRKFSVISADGGLECSLAIIAALRRGEVVAMHGDRCLGPNRARVRFLGGEVELPTGPYLVAALSGAPLVYAFAMREKAYHYRMLALPSRELAFTSEEPREGQLRRWIQDFATELEKIVRQYPLQWQNFYEFWPEESAKEVAV
jgi:predicted LPLAT superfamily acyltransferase